jgi:hypothetical protein
MILPLVFFILSGLVLVSLIVHKRLELSHGKGLVVLDMLSDFDHKVTSVSDKLKDQAALVNKHNTFKVLNGAFVFVVRVLLAIVEWVRNHIHALYEKARHEKPKLEANGSSSVYLKHISEVKEDKNAPL